MLKFCVFFSESLYSILVNDFFRMSYVDPLYYVSIVFLPQMRKRSGVIVHHITAEESERLRAQVPLPRSAPSPCSNRPSSCGSHEISGVYFSEKWYHKIYITLSDTHTLPISQNPFQWGIRGLTSNYMSPALVRCQPMSLMLWFH